MPPNADPPTPPDPNADDDDLHESGIQVSIDQLVPFLNDFFAAMDALRGEPPPTAPNPGSAS
jgi:hypothetical protein